MIKMLSDSSDKLLESQLAIKDNWSNVYNFLESFAFLSGISKKDSLKILLASEEIFANISNYAYPNKTGEVKITVECSTQQGIIKLLFEDWGIPFNPLLIKKPQINIPPSQRKIGGLGIFMVRRVMDNIDYEYAEGKNRLLITKNLTNNQGGDCGGNNQVSRRK